MMDKKSPNKILKERVLFYKQKQTRITWDDIKKFKFEDWLKELKFPLS